MEYFGRAYSKAPRDSKACLAFARVNHDLENYYEARRLYEELKALDPDLAERFGYLDLKGEEATRAAAINGVAEVVEWDE